MKLEGWIEQSALDAMLGGEARSFAYRSDPHWRVTERPIHLTAYSFFMLLIGDKTSVAAKLDCDFVQIVSK